MNCNNRIGRSSFYVGLMRGTLFYDNSPPSSSSRYVILSLDMKSVSHGSLQMQHFPVHAEVKVSFGSSDHIKYSRLSLCCASMNTTS